MTQKVKVVADPTCYHCGHSGDDHPNKFLCHRSDVTSDDGTCRCRGWRERMKPGDLSTTTVADTLSSDSRGGNL